MIKVKCAHCDYMCETLPPWKAILCKLRLRRQPECWECHDKFLCRCYTRQEALDVAIEKEFEATRRRLSEYQSAGGEDAIKFIKKWLDKRCGEDFKHWKRE